MEAILNNMKINIDYNRITQIFSTAESDGRKGLFEYETYTLLDLSGAESTPRTRFLEKNSRISNEAIAAFAGEKVVLKIVSPAIVHKSDVKGVCVVEKNPGKVRSAWRRMMDKVSETYSARLENNLDHAPENYRNLTGETLRKAVSDDIRGVLMCEYMPPDSTAFGNELLVSLRCTREFGMVITAGLGGIDTELYAHRFRKGQAVVSAATAMIDGNAFLQLFSATIAYRKLAGLTRGGQRLVSDSQLLECFTSFIAMGNYYAPDNPDAPYIIEELEINPFTFSDYQMVPLDGLCRFTKALVPDSIRIPRHIRQLLHPGSIVVVGVSARKMNFGRIILNNIIASGFKRSAIRILSDNSDSIDGVACVSDITLLDQKVDLMVLAVNATRAADLIDRIIDHDAARSVILIPGGLGEKKGSEQRARQIKQKMAAAHNRPTGGPVFLGGNCLGIISHPGSYDTFFIPEEKLPKHRTPCRRNVALISQSGAFAVARINRLSFADPLYTICVGNQMDLTIGDFTNYLAAAPEIDVMAIYAEGFTDMDGLHMCRGIRRAIQNGKEVILYKAGRTPEGKLATAGHTASVAGDYMVCESCVTQAGAVVVDDIAQFDGLLMLASMLHDKNVKGSRLAAVSGAGFEAVGMADYLEEDDDSFKMASFEPKTIEKIQKRFTDNRLDSLVDIKNPIDINPAANDHLHTQVVETLCNDPGVDSIIVGLDPFSPAVQTLPENIRATESLSSPDSIALLMPELARRTAKPVIGVIDAGRRYEPMAELMEKNGLPIFRTCDAAVTTLAKYTGYRLRIEKLRKKN
jgi:acyl-CoA synthetase (NDP forming)